MGDPAPRRLTFPDVLVPAKALLGRPPLRIHAEWHQDVDVIFAYPSGIGFAVRVSAPPAAVVHLLRLSGVYMFNLNAALLLLPIIMSGIKEAQELFAKPDHETPTEKAERGRQKKGHVLNLVKLSVAGTNQAAGHPVLDPASAEEAADHLIEGVVAAAKVPVRAVQTGAGTAAGSGTGEGHAPR